jgi:hypothetical protein
LLFLSRDFNWFMLVSSLCPKVNHEILVSTGIIYIWYHDMLWVFS